MCGTLGAQILMQSKIQIGAYCVLIFCTFYHTRIFTQFINIKELNISSNVSLYHPDYLLDLGKDLKFLFP